MSLPASNEPGADIYEHYHFLSNELLLHNNLLYAIDDAIHVLDAAEPTALRLIQSSEPLGHFSSRAQIIDGWIIIADRDILYVYDITTPLSPRRVSSFEIGADHGIGIFGVEPVTTEQGRFLLLSVGSRSILASDTRSGLVVLDFNDPTNLFEAVTLDRSTIGHVSHIAREGERIYVDEYHEDGRLLHELDFSNVAAPTINRTPLSGFRFGKLEMHDGQLLFLHWGHNCPFCLFVFDGAEVREIPLSAEPSEHGGPGNIVRLLLKSVDDAVIVSGEEKLYYITRP